jgi:flavin-dependent dehydrogenase
MPISAKDSFDCQVVVIGGGPAGVAAACAAAECELDVVVVERGQPGRDKACGDMFMPSATAVLGQFGFDGPTLRSIGGCSRDAIEIHGGSGLLWTLNYVRDPVWMLPRRLIDQTLRDSLEPRTQVFYDASVFDVSPGQNGRLDVRAHTAQRTRTFRFKCDAVIAACGTQSTLTARWGISGNPLVAPSISAYVRSSGIDTPAFGFGANCHPGYWWAFPIGTQQENIGICALDQCRGAQLKSRGRALAARMGLAGDLNWRGGGGALWSGRGDRWHHDVGIVSCGDAAGLIDPLNGEGLTASLRSGREAGLAVGRFLDKRRDLSCLRNYSAWIRKTFASEYESESPLRIAWRQLVGLRTRRGAVLT